MLSKAYSMIKRDVFYPEEEEGELTHEEKALKAAISPFILPVSLLRCSKTALNGAVITGIAAVGAAISAPLILTGDSEPFLEFVKRSTSGAIITGNAIKLAASETIETAFFVPRVVWHTAEAIREQRHDRIREIIARGPQREKGYEDVAIRR